MQESGLVYGSAVVGDLVNKDTDGDGVLDWEESLWGTNPTLAETTSGTPDKNAIEKLKIAQGITNENTQNSSLNSDGTENLTETDKFSRELFSTVAALNQNGAMDEATVEKLSSSLVERMQNNTPRTTYTIADIIIATKDDAKTTREYNTALNNVEENKNIDYTVLDVLQKFITTENSEDPNISIDSSVLSELDPIIEQTNTIKNAMLKMKVPQSLSESHLNVINAMEKIIENLSDLQLYDTDVIISLSAMTQYEQNSSILESEMTNLGNAILKKMNN